jgi:elongation factor G
MTDSHLESAGVDRPLRQAPEIVMPKYTTEEIRNVVLVGHGGAGKTSLGEAILHITGATSRLGSVTDRTSYLDYSEEAKERGGSVDSAVCFAQVEGKQINVIDTPGSPDFVGPAIAALAGVETAICVISATAGIEVNTRRMMEKAKEYGLGRIIVINKIDAENANFGELLPLIRETFGNECQPINLPAGGGRSVIDCYANESGESDFGSVGDAHTAVVEGIVGADDALMEKYFSGDLTAQELAGAAAKAVSSGVFVPICFTNARDEVGVKELLKVIVDCTPSPAEGFKRTLVDGEIKTTVEPDPAGDVVGQVFTVTSDPRSNIKYSMVRIHCGTLKSDTDLHMSGERKGQRPGQLHKSLGAEHPDIDLGIPGDIIAVAKLDLHIGSVVFTGQGGTIEMPKFPQPMFSLAIEPKSRGDADKVSSALHRFTEEDPCFTADREPSTSELVIHGVGDMHLRTILAKMHRYFKLEVETKVPKIPYRETVTAVARDIEYTHKKQTGGAGQFARVVITVEPNERGAGYEFVDDIFGGVIDQQFRPSVDKGVRAQMVEGVLAGYPVVDVKVHLTDGKTHPVDSKDIAFQIAGRSAFKEGFMKAKPILLEPIVNLEVTIPNANVGDIQGDLASRRGRPKGQDSLPGGMMVIKAQIPLAEVSDYHSRLSSITGGQGSYSMELSHYEPVPGNLQMAIIEAAKKAKEKDKE